MSERQKRAKKPRPNRAQRRALEIRAAESNVPAPLDLTVALDQEEIIGEAPFTVAGRRTSRRVVQATSYVLPRDVEYAYIRSDLKRLLLTAGALLALMLILLFIID